MKEPLLLDENARECPPSDTTPSAADQSGWSLHPREIGDFYHRVRFYPPEVSEWRKHLVERVRTEPKRFTAVPRNATVDEIRAQVDEGITFLREIARITAAIYGTPRLGNMDDPVDELVYIILSRKTREGAYQTAFAALKKRFKRWDQLLAARRSVVAKLIYSGGLSKRKTDSLYGALQALKDTFGRCTLEPARDWSDEKLEQFLCSLPEIHRKSAYCIMMYSFGRAVLPVDTHVGRVLARLGPYRELGLNLEGLDHKKLQATLAELIPPNLRYSLHVNLIEHGRAVCKAPRPLCNACDIRNFCGTYRKNEVARVDVQEAPTVVDLFCGAGGLSVGFGHAGFKLLLALDQDPAALKTYWLNHPGLPDDRLLRRDIRDLKPGELRRRVGQRPEVLIGAPPCQGFSHAGFRSKQKITGYELESDARNFLFESMVAAALELKPKLFLMENVPGMQSARSETTSFLEKAAKLLEEKGGFATAIWRFNASAYGVPQDRIRYFLVAARGVPLPGAPVEEYKDLHRKSFDVDALDPVGVDDAIFDLPPRASGRGPMIDVWGPRDLSAIRFRRYLGKFKLLGTSRVLYNHVARYNNERDLELYALLQPGEDSVHALERYGRADLMRYRADVFDDKYARLRGDRPSKTIVSHLAKDGNGYIHPSQVRSITVREAARIQSFPDEYVFCGAPTDQWVQVGNAVPPVLAETVAKSFMRTLKSGGQS